MEQTITQEENNNSLTDSISANIPLYNITLPHTWILYLYDKQLFKKMANRPNFKAMPHKEICSINTVNDFIYYHQLMEVKHNDSGKLNLDMNDYIIMRKGIEPIWEDPKNWSGGTFTIKMNHTNGFKVWSLFVMHMLGETLTKEMEYINGITVSYIADTHGTNGSGINPECFTYIKIWDGKPDRTLEQFVNILPKSIIDCIRHESLMYSPNNKKKHFGESNLITKLTTPNRGRGRGGFVDRGGFSRRGGRGRY